MNENKKENKPEYYFCPEKNCNEIPKIINIDSDSGNILFNCNKHGDKEINVIEYLNILQNKKEAKPKGNSNPETINSDEIKKIKNALDDKMNNLNKNKVFYQSILDMQTEFPYNYFHNKNVIDIAEYIKEGNSRSLRDYKINYEEIYKNKENQEKNIESLKKNYKIIVNYDKEHKGVLQQWAEFQNKNLKDSGFKLISQIVFKNLIILNLSNNEIKDISPLNEMILPHLEIIDLSRNKIENIEPVANLLSKKLSNIQIEYNSINDFEPLLHSNFPSLTILNVINNKEGINNNSFKAVVKKYKDKIIYELNWDIFDKKYNCNYSDIDQRLDLGSKRSGDIILKDLYPLINYTNSIEYLILDNNKLNDVSLLKKMPLNNLNYLDLSLNLIFDIIFLKQMSKICVKLKTLYLHDNKITDISPLLKDNEDLIFNLDTLTLKNNNFNSKDKDTKDILTKLIKINNLIFDYQKKDL